MSQGFEESRNIAPLWSNNVKFLQYRELMAYGSEATSLNVGAEELVSRVMVTIKDQWVKAARTMIFKK